VIEVAESSLAYDRSTKQRLYAETRIPEYWVVDCAAEAIEVTETRARRLSRGVPAHRPP
jgi:Uma2 family endonuclease